MSLRDYLQRLEERQGLVCIREPASKNFEIAGVLKKLEPTPVLFENVKGSPFRVVGNLFCSKAAFADYFNIPVKEIIPRLAAAIDQRTPPEIVEDAVCQEESIRQPDAGTPVANARRAALPASR